MPSLILLGSSIDRILNMGSYMVISLVPKWVGEPDYMVICYIYGYLWLYIWLYVIYIYLTNCRQLVVDVYYKIVSSFLSSDKHKQWTLGADPIMVVSYQKQRKRITQFSRATMGPCVCRMHKTRPPRSRCPGPVSSSACASPPSRGGRCPWRGCSWSTS